MLKALRWAKAARQNPQQRTLFLRRTTCGRAEVPRSTRVVLEKDQECKARHSDSVKRAQAGGVGGGWGANIPDFVLD